MKARLGTTKVLHFLDTDLGIGGGALVAQVQNDGEVLHQLTLNPLASIPDLFISEAFTPAVVGNFAVVYTLDGNVVSRETLEVGQPLSDAAIDTDTVVSIAGSVVGGVAETITLHAIDSTGASIVPDGGQDPIPAAYEAGYAGYTATVTFASEGDYFLVWAKDGIPEAVEQVLVLRPYGLENVRFYCGTLQGNNGTPHIETTIVMSDSSGTQKAIGVTGVDGILNIEAAPGAYIVTLVKAGTAFSINNFSITVGDSILEGLGERQVYQLVTESFDPTLSDPQDFAAMCEMFASIYRMDGRPLAHAPIQIRMISTPQLYDGTTVYDSQLFFRTDSNGQVRFQLIQGIEIEVAIPPLGLRRKVTIPTGDDAATPVNLFTLLSDANDLFDIQKPQIQKAPRRTR